MEFSALSLCFVSPPLHTLFTHCMSALRFVCFFLLPCPLSVVRCPSLLLSFFPSLSRSFRVSCSALHLLSILCCLLCCLAVVHLTVSYAGVLRSHVFLFSLPLCLSLSLLSLVVSRYRWIPFLLLFLFTTFYDAVMSDTRSSIYLTRSLKPLHFFEACYRLHICLYQD